MSEEKDYKLGVKLKVGRFQITEFIRKKKTENGEFESSDFSVQKSWLKRDGDPKKKEDWDSQKISLFDLKEITQLKVILEELERKILLK